MQDKSYEEVRQEYLNLISKFMSILKEGDYDEIEKLGGSHARSQIFKSATDFFKTTDKITALEKIKTNDENVNVEMHLDFLEDDDDEEETQDGNEKV